MWGILLKSVIKAIAKKGADSSVTKIYQQFGTPMQVANVNVANCFPTRYWQSGHFEQWEKISADYMQENFEVEACGCPTCFLRCTNLSTITHGRHKGLTLEGPEFETVALLGANLSIYDLVAITQANYWANRYGLDTISLGGTIAAFIELYSLVKSKKEKRTAEEEEFLKDVRPFLTPALSAASSPTPATPTPASSRSRVTGCVNPWPPAT